MSRQTPEQRDEARAETVHAIGIWTLRVALVIGAVVAGVMGKREVSGGCIMGLVASFILL